MSCVVINIGTELLSGEILNTNLKFLSRSLLEEGIPVKLQVTLPDDKEEIKRTLQELFPRFSIFIITGGLGPTQDDLTREAVSEATGLPLILERGLRREIEERLRERGRKLLPEQEKMAYLPRGAKPLPNSRGLAPGIYLEWEGRKIFLLPGVPEEMQEVWKSVRRFLDKERNVHYRWETLKTWGLPESEINRRIKDLMEKKNPRIGLLPSISGVEITLCARGGTPVEAEEILERTEEELRRRLGDFIYSSGNTPMEKVVGALLRIKKKTVSVAESCTGGKITARLTNIPGSSAYFMGGVVVYSNSSKVNILKVKEETLMEKGAVSEDVAKEMAQRVREIFSTDLGVSVTGIAGPGGGTPEKPVGLVYIALNDGENSRVKRNLFPGDRESVREKATLTALDLLRRYLIGSI